MSFEELGLSQPILAALELKEYTTPTPIQAQAIPTVLTGRDLLGIAQTGTGKTAAFMLPSIDRLVASNKRPRPKTCRMLVLAPTRELAGQIAQNAREYSRFAHLNVVTVFGGTSVHRNRQDVQRGVDILIATPGRLVDLAEQRAIDLSGVEILVLDEADQMLDLGFIHALKQIVRLIPKDRQTLFFSATMPNSIKQLADQYLTNPAQVSVAPASSTAERVEQYVCFLAQMEKQALLNMALRKGLASKEMDRVLVFTRTKHGADRVVRKLGQAGVKANAIHGNKSQPQREKALAEFKQGRVPVLVATDIAARGIDVSGVSHVFNYELPNVPEQYVHRIGRTARAGADGVAISLCAPDEREYLRDIQKLTKVTLKQVPIPANLRAEVEETKRREAENPPPPREERFDRREPRGGRRPPRKQVTPRPLGERAERPERGECKAAVGGKPRGNGGCSGGGNKQRRRGSNGGGHGGGHRSRGA